MGIEGKTGSLTPFPTGISCFESACDAVKLENILTGSSFLSW
jgi:hypothetical protein